MDTKSRKYHKIAVVLILLTVLLPSFIFVELYPQVEKAMMNLKQEYDREYEEEKAAQNQYEYEFEYAFSGNFINYAVEANYWLYGELLSQAGEQVDKSVLFEYGWHDDYERVSNQTRYDVELAYTNADGETKGYRKLNSGSINDTSGYLKFTYDADGNVTVEVDDNICWEHYYSEYDTLEEVVQASEEQYLRNVYHYNNMFEAKIDADQLQPKNFEAMYVLEFDEYNGFWIHADDIYGDLELEHYYKTTPQNLFFQTGSYIVVIPMAIFVALVALLLPCIKCLGTGKEKIFSMPFEIMLCVCGATITAAVGMTWTMAYVNMYTLEQITIPKIMGFEIPVNQIYNICLVACVIGWALVFFGEYIVISNLRQLLFNMKHYLKHQTIIGKFFGWLLRKIKKFFVWVAAIDFKENMNKAILKIVVINFVILTVLCCLWLFGVAGLLIYSVVLFWLLQKYGKKLKAQYDSILGAMKEMGNGNLKISLEEELGVFDEMGESLKQVQEGFKKAVVEEAKSQNMKSELITNVSHDLKTPLTAIITYVDLLKKEDITEEQRASYIATLDQKSQRLKALVEDLFEVSKANSGNVQMNFADINVVSLLKQVRSEMDDDIQKSNLQFRWNLPEEKVILSLDGQRMYRVFENLIRNAIKYSMPYSRVYVDVFADMSDVQIVFRNMSAMEMNYQPEQLTERFVRGDVARNSEGNGLGLAIVKSFVELQNGTFKIEVDGDLFKAIISFQK